MKSYLNLIPILAKVRRRQNRLTLLFIIFAVFLVTAVFSMADMMVRMEAAKLPVEISLGSHHAKSVRKNLILMTSSFALSIILFLTFSVLLDFVGYLLPSPPALPTLRSPVRPVSLVSTVFPGKRQRRSVGWTV